METGDDIKPLLTLIDLQKGFKNLSATLKTGQSVSIHVKAPSWEQLASVHLESGNDSRAVEKALLEIALPAMLDDHEGYQPFAWLDWLDIESRNEVTRCVREFAYGFQTEKKRTLAVREISKLLSARNAKLPPNASGSALPTPSPGAAPSSPSSPPASAESKPTTA